MRNELKNVSGDSYAYVIYQCWIAGALGLISLLFVFCVFARTVDILKY